MNAPAFAKARTIAGWITVAVCCGLYAVLAHRSTSAALPGWFEALVVSAPLLAVALVMAWRSGRRAAWMALWVAAVAVILVGAQALPDGTLWLVLLQNVGINAAMGLAFGRTLAPGSVPLVSRFAQVVHGTLSPRLAASTRSVTLAWVVYFALTTVVSLVLFFCAPSALWSGFVNLLSLPLLGAMFAGEYMVRLVVIPAQERTGFFQAVAAYRKFSGARTDAAR